MLTESNFKRNLVTARRNAGQRLGLLNFDGSDVSTVALPYDSLRLFNQYLAWEILRNPESFDRQRVETAEQIVITPDAPLSDASWSVKEFAGEMASNAVPVLGNFTNKLLIVGTIVAVVYFAILAMKSSPRST